MRRKMRAGLLLGLAGTGLAVWAPAPAWAELRFRAVPDSTEWIQPLADEIPDLPTAWRLRLANMGGLPTDGAPTVSVTIDPASGRVRESFRQGDVEIRDPIVASNSEYAALLSERTTRRLWKESMRSTRSMQRGTGPQKGLFRVELPVQLPKAVRSIVGDGAPNIEISGSENISLAGNSDWTASPTIQTEAQKQSAFPSFEMKQELNVNLTGSIGDKIKVDVDQSSNVQTSLDNKVKLRYEGDDDDMIKSVELGNTNLSLAGASIRQDGLFGVKTVAKLGNVDVTTIASKQEGKSETARFTPSGDLTRVLVRDLDYIKHQYFFITDHAANIDYGTLKIWKDDQNTNNNTGEAVGFGRLDPTRPESPTNPQIFGFFQQLQPQTDYVIQDDLWVLDNGLKIPVIRLTVPLQDVQTLGVQYVDKTDPNNHVTVGGTIPGAPGPDGKVVDTLLVKMIKPKAEDIGTGGASGADYDTTSAWYPTLPLELRNFYNLGAQNISLETLTFKIRKTDNAQATDPDNLDGTAYMKMLGLDQKGPGGVNAPDGQIDPQYIDLERGIVFFPDLNPYDPVAWPRGLCAGNDFGIFCLNDPGRNKLRPAEVPGDPNETANPIVYFRKNVNPSTDSRYYIDAQFKSSRNGYFVGRFNILEGSEIVKVDGVPKKRDTDYQIDYDTGQITFLRPPGPDQVVTVDYSFAPGVGQVQRTLLGFSTSYNPAANLSFSSSVLYESRGAQEQNVKLGEEPATSMLGDLSTVLSFRPVWMTQLANSVPGVRTSQPSALNIQGNVSTSIPNPNTKGEAFIDDMEGNRESSTISLLRSQWFWSSVPTAAGLEPAKDTLVADHAVIQWHAPKPGSVQEHDLKPVLRDDEGGKNEHQTLQMDVDPPPNETAMGPEDWTGITQALSTVGQDLTKVQFVEVWVNDFRADHTLTKAMLHVDFGRVSEDAYWDKNTPPNGKLDTEDKDGDNQLRFDEDTGLDGVADPQEPGYDASTNPDPNRDDYRYATGSNDFSGINNTEKNATGDPNAQPDTEDLNRNRFLDLVNDYFEFTLDLSDSQFVAVDVPKQYAGYPVVTSNSAGNGWRLFRIPIVDSTYERIGSPSWEGIQASRLWLDGMTAPLRLQIGRLSFGDSSGAPSPVRVVLRQNHPNPFNPSTTISYSLPAEMRVRLVIFDVQGRFVRELVNRAQIAGTREAVWNGRDAGDRPVPSGIYFFRLEAGGASLTRRMVLVK
ncbi:MAG TPA: cell surface protein SprA [Candidatus Eisenbacteria bacterium]